MIWEQVRKLMTFSSSVFPFIIHENWIEREIRVHFAFSIFIRCSPFRLDCHFWVTSSYPCLLPSWIIYLLQTHNSICFTIFLFFSLSYEELELLLQHLSRGKKFHFPHSCFLPSSTFSWNKTQFMLSTHKILAYYFFLKPFPIEL